MTTAVCYIRARDYGTNNVDTLNGFADKLRTLIKDMQLEPFFSSINIKVIIDDDDDDGVDKVCIVGAKTPKDEFYLENLVVTAFLLLNKQIAGTYKFSFTTWGYDDNDDPKALGEMIHFEAKDLPTAKRMARRLTKGYSCICLKQRGLHRIQKYTPGRGWH